jgi:enoyl-CoA hydratase
MYADRTGPRGTAAGDFGHLYDHGSWPRPALRSPAMSDTRIVVEEVEDGVTQFTLNRPDQLNALDAQLVEELHAALGRVAADRSCRAVVLTGAGRGFCAGLDLNGYGTPPGAEGLGRVQAGFATQQHIAALMTGLRDLPQPVISAVNGPAAGGGLALALASDIRIAAASARFNVAFVRIGLSGCDMGVSWLLPRLVGASRAYELMLTGRIIDAAEAERIGLVLRVVPDGELLGAAYDVAGQIAANSPWGVRMTKEVMWSQLEVGSFRAGIDLENRTQVLSSYTGDMEEAVRAFMEKRPARYTT